MPLYLGSLLGGVAQGQDLAQQAEARKLQQQKLAYDFEQTKQANARALQAEQATGDVYKQFAPPPVTGPTNQGPLPPPPGTASVSQMGPQPQVPNMTRNQPSAPAGPMPQVPNTTPGQTQYIPPYASVQSAGQQNAARQAAMAASQQQPALLAPPSQGGQQQVQQDVPAMTYANVVQALQKSNSDPSLWPAIITRMMPLMDMESRNQATQALNQHRQVLEAQNAQRIENQGRNIESLISKRGGAGGAASMYDVPAPGGAPGAAPKTQKTGEDFLKSLDPKVARDVQAVAEGRMSLKNVSLKGNERRKLENLVNQYTDGKFNEQDVAVASKALQAFGTGKQGDLVRSSNTINEHMVDLRDAVKALNNKDITTLNRVGNQIAQWSGGTAPTDFNTVKTFVGDEVAKFLIPGVGSVKDREEVKNLLSTASSPEQLNKAIGRFESLMGGQLRSLQQQYKGSTSRDDFDRLLNSRSKQLLGGSGGASTAAEGVPAGWSVKEK